MNFQKLSFLALMLTAISAQALGADKSPGQYFERMSIDGVERSYLLKVPRSCDGSKPLPMVIVLHGWTSNAKTAESGFRMDAACEREGFVLVAPNGLGSPQGWNAGFIDLSGKRADEVKFIDQLIDHVEAEVKIDPDRIFIAGHSNGAFLAHLLGARLSQRIAAFAAVAGTIGIPQKDGAIKTIPETLGPVSAILVHGKQDRMVSYTPNAPALLHGVSAADSARWWAKRDGCASTPQKIVTGNGNVVTDIYSNGKAGTEVRLVTIANGKHDWPGGISLSGPEIETGVNATRLILEFFWEHPKRH